MKKALVVVDMQKDFISGALGTKEAEAVVDNVAEVIRTFDGEVIFTRDTHTDKYLETQEGRNLRFRTVSKTQTAGSLTKSLRRSGQNL